MFANRLPGLLLAILVTLPQIAGAQDDDDDENGSEDFADLIEDATFRPGFFDTYEKDEHLYLVIPDGRIGQDFLLSMEVARGIGSGGLTGGLMMNIFDADIVALERHGSKVYLVHKPHRYVADAGSPQEDALSLTFGSSVLASASIDASPGDSAIVIDTYDWFVSDLSGVGQVVNDIV